MSRPSASVSLTLAAQRGGAQWGRGLRSMTSSGHPGSFHLVALPVRRASPSRLPVAAVSAAARGCWASRRGSEIREVGGAAPRPGWLLRRARHIWPREAAPAGSSQVLTSSPGASISIKKGGAHPGKTLTCPEALCGFGPSALAFCPGSTGSSSGEGNVSDTGIYV